MRAGSVAAFSAGQPLLRSVRLSRDADSTRRGRPQQRRLVRARLPRPRCSRAHAQQLLDRARPRAAPVSGRHQPDARGERTRDRGAARGQARCHPQGQLRRARARARGLSGAVRGALALACLGRVRRARTGRRADGARHAGAAERMGSGGGALRRARTARAERPGGAGSRRPRARRARRRGCDPHPQRGPRGGQQRLRHRSRARAALERHPGQAAGLFPGCALVGYERGEHLETALRAGFTTIGALRVWSASR